MIAVILFSVVILATAIGFIMWATNLDKREKELKKEESRLQVHLAQVRAMNESVNKKQKDADDAWQKCLEEGNRLMEKQHELEAREAEIEGKERRLGFIVTPAPDVIEPVEEPAKPVKKARKGGKK